jgi:ferredoxin
MRIGFDTLVTTPLDMSLNDTPCVSCGRCAETCPTGALMPKPRVLEKYDVDESRCILCGICVDACPYDALRDGAEFELSHESRSDPMIDLIALASVDQESEITYIRRERDWLERAAAEGRPVRPDRLLPVLPPAVSAAAGNGHRNGDGSGNGHGHAHGPGDYGSIGIGPGTGPAGGEL